MAPSSNPRYLLDTSILVHYVRGKELGLHIEEKYTLKLALSVPLISAVAEGELRSLALQFKWGPEKYRSLRAILDHFVVVQLDLPGIYDAYAEIDHFSRQSGIPMGKNDIWIAATAHVTHAHLLTCDKDFNHLNPAYLVSDYIDPNYHD